LGDAGDELLSGAGGDDLILGNDGADTLLGGAGNDHLRGDGGDDVAFGGEGNDDVFGGDGDDMLFGDAGNDRIFGGDGDDVANAGEGADAVFGGAGDDRVLASVNDGNDVYWGEDGQDTLDYSAITADLSVDLGAGPLQHGSVASAETGVDAVFGFENVIGGSGDDTITASDAVNVMDGGSGDNVFVFRSVVSADGDVIRGFNPGDRIDLSGIDANTGAAGHQAFTLVGTGMNTAGNVVVSYETRDDGEHTILTGHVDDDEVADFTIDLVGNQTSVAIG